MSACRTSAPASPASKTRPSAPEQRRRRPSALAGRSIPNLTAMIDRIPSGTRDVLPDEMRELRAVTDRIRSVFESAGYGEVATPALEYEGTFARSDMAGSRPAYRVFDEQGNVLILRPDMTVPIARLVATRYANAEPPLRFCYFAHAYRVVRPQRGQSREFLQAGVELIGSPGPEGTAE